MNRTTITILIVITLVFAVGGIVYTTNRAEPLAQVSPAPSPTPAEVTFLPSPAQTGNYTPVPTPKFSTWSELLRNVSSFPAGSDWKTYKNETFEFEIKYPHSWTYEVSKNQYDITTVIFSRKDAGNWESKGRELVLNVLKKDINQYLEEIGQLSSQKRTTAPFLINNVNWTLLDPGIEVDDVMLDLYASRNGTVFTLSNAIAASSYDIMISMIGSFRFTDSAK